MEWLKAAMGGDSEGEAAITEAYDDGRRAAQRFMKSVIDESRKYADADKHMEASLMIFSAVLHAAGHAKMGVHNANKKGTDNPVNKMWTLLELVLLAPSAEAGVEAVAKWQKENPDA